MFQNLKVVAAAVCLFALPAVAFARNVTPVVAPPDATTLAQTRTASPIRLVAHEVSSARTRVLRDRRVHLDTRPTERPLGGVVGPDNYQYWRQACCL